MTDEILNFAMLAEQLKKTETLHVKKEPEVMFCSGGCGKLVAKPEWMSKVKITGSGKINILCQDCSKHAAYDAEVKKKEEGIKINGTNS